VNDPAVDEAYDGLGWTHAFYQQVYGRNSIDDQGMRLEAVVHYSDHYDNAFFNGEYMVFGDGDGEYFNRFTIALDIIGHELTHGVTASEAALVYVGQAGSLNESLSDVFGSMIKQYALNQTVEQADWLIGKGLFTSRVEGEALRSLRAPGTAFRDATLGNDPQPAMMDNYVRTVEDDGGVHINSGIPNHAFYLAAMKIGGFAWQSTGRIWYETMRDSRLRPAANFQAFARLTLDNAEKLYGMHSRERNAVQEAWDEVGVLRIRAIAGMGH
jgi:Zn-dependent metalloprotease